MPTIDYLNPFTNQWEHGVDTVRATEINAAFLQPEEDRPQYCRHCRTLFDQDTEFHTVYDEIEVCDGCFYDNYATCSECGCVHDCEEVHTIGDSDTLVCTGCIEDNYFSCGVCNELAHNEDRCRCDTCESCWEDMDEDQRIDYAIADAERRRPRMAVPAPARPSESRPPIRPQHSDCCASKVFDRTDNTLTYERIGSKRTFGVEIETSQCPGAEILSNKTCFASREDGSIGGFEFTSAILCGDEGLDEIDHFCEVAEELGFTVDGRCGFHAHFGTNDVAEQTLFKIAAAYAATYKLWTRFVSASRRANRFCLQPAWTIGKRPEGTLMGQMSGHNYLDFYGMACDTQRYGWFNINAYTRHKTLEMRLHSGTLSARKITAWVIAHARFMDWAEQASVDEVFNLVKQDYKQQFVHLESLLPGNIANFLAKRAEYFEAPVR